MFSPSRDCFVLFMSYILFPSSYSLLTDPEDLCCISLSCKTLNEVADDDRLWVGIYPECMGMIPDKYLSDYPPPPLETLVYRSMYQPSPLKGRTNQQQYCCPNEPNNYDESRYDSQLDFSR